MASPNLSPACPQPVPVCHVLDISLGGGSQILRSPLEHQNLSLNFQANGYFQNLQNGVFVNNGGDNSKISARGHWRQSEDDKLRQLVSHYGPQNWNIIAEKLDGRSGKSCRLRWFNQLDPKINKRAFTEEEEEKLLRAHRVYGNKWAMIARLFPGRTDNAVKNHWHVVDARKQRENASSTNNVYKRRKPFTRAEILSTQHTSTVACSHESTITSAKDESNSTCTDLSLNSFSNKVQPELQLGFSRTAPKLNSQVSTTDTVATNEKNNQSVVSVEDENRSENKNNVNFIDFLGVGAL
ncbi:hypothetical protein GIB67_037763 [Kingdonia uniflora]|uniref:Uncharacterized protein n=1 Tax=Kingdonia uniflora TaxID=39325 RepID=A0A7J7LUY7_9MAGN|nr:hypothetical protein GIB67_037763 [Kingdonia uniflora]